MGLQEDILSLAERSAGGPASGDPESDFLGAFGMEGGNATKFLDRFEERYEGSLDGFLWYFHFKADQAPFYRRMIAVDGDGKDISQSPITLTDLIRAAEAGRWPIAYPAHFVRTSRFLRVVQFMVALAVLGLVAATALLPVL